MRLWTASSKTVTLFVVSITASSAVSNMLINDKQWVVRTVAKVIVLPQRVLRIKSRYGSGNRGPGELLTDALEILQLPQEDGYEGVVLEMVLCSSFEKNVGFVEE